MSCKLEVILFLLIVLCVVSCTQADEVVIPPQGWLLLDDKNIDNSLGWRSESSRRYLHDIGDFNGDGIDDYVGFFIKEAIPNVEGLFVRISERNHKKWYFISQLTHDDGKIHMGVETIPAGDYETKMCLNFDSHEQCVSNLSIKFDSILYFGFGGSSKIYWWDTENHNFEVFVYTE